MCVCVCVYISAEDANILHIQPWPSDAPSSVLAGGDDTHACSILANATRDEHTKPLAVEGVYMCRCVRK